MKAHSMPGCGDGRDLDQRGREKHVIAAARMDRVVDERLAARIEGDPEDQPVELARHQIERARCGRSGNQIV